MTRSGSIFQRTWLLQPAERDAWRGFVMAGAGLVRRVDDELRSAHDLPVSSFDVLAALFLAEDHRLRMSALADALVLTRSGVTRLVERLEGSGFVVREETEVDPRAVYARLTEEGFRMFDAAADTYAAVLREHFLGRLRPGEAARLVDLWDRLEPGSCRERERWQRAADAGQS